MKTEESLSITQEKASDDPEKNNAEVTYRDETILKDLTTVSSF